jgi:acyl-coenzyme A synthetase/AMP-(fatty) acid ligase/acyl carrier protein
VIVVAGEVLPVRTAAHWSRLLGDGRLVNEYGPTETSVGACVYPVPAPPAGESVPIGRPLPGVSMRVLDDRLRPLPVGVPGELYVGGVGVARGYANQPALTAARFLPDPYGPPGSRVYRTGDLARLLPAGDVDFIGRRDGQVKISGYRVEPDEVAAVVAAHPAVRDAVVVADRDPAGTRLIAYHLPVDIAPGERELAEHCAARLPAFMVPAVFVPVDAIPLTANGKLDRAALPPVRPESPDDLVTPRGVVEQRVAEVFTELLGAPAGAHSNFFQLGGNSILAIRLIAAVQNAFDVNLPIRAVFEGPTVAELAGAVETEIRAEVERMSDADLIAESRRLEQM